MTTVVDLTANVGVTQVVLDPVDGANATNLVTNPSFEVDTTGWQATPVTGGYVATNAVLTRETAGAYVGVGRLAITTTASPAAQGAIHILSGTFQSGVPYSLNLRVAGAGTSISVYLGAKADGANAAHVTFANTGGWTQRTVTWTPSVTATDAVVCIRNDSASAVAIYADAVQVEQAATASPYFDGNTVGNTPASQYAWTGTPHASTSTRTNNRSELDISDYVAAAGIDWGDSEIAAYMADQERGSSPVDFRIPNRQVVIPLILKDIQGRTFAQAKTDIQAKTALLQSEGGWLKRVNASGGTVYADVVNATLKLPDSWLGTHREVEPDAQLTLECVPDFYGAESALTDHTETSLPELVFTETAVLGDYPGRVRIVVDEDQAQDQLGLIWGIRSRHYSAASTARLAYEAEALTPLDTAAITAAGTASGGNTIRHTNLATGWTPVMNTNLLAGTFLTHTGTYRVMARVYSSSPASGVDVRTRFVWDVGDMTLPVENAAWTFPGASNFYIADLGEIRLDPSPTGPHRWQGQIQAKGSVGGENVYVDRIWFVPVDEGMGILRAPIALTDGLTAFSGRDEFNQSVSGGSDPLTGKTAAVGGAWVGAGDADDFVVEDTGHTAQRTAVSDTGVGRFATLDLNLTRVCVQADTKFSAAVGVTRGVVARYVDPNNFVAAALFGGGDDLFVYKSVAGSITILGAVDMGQTPQPGDRWMPRLLVDAAGRYLAWAGLAGSPPTLRLAGQDAALATGGALASGDAGIWDYASGASAVTRNYDNFAAWVPPRDAVAFASQSVQLGTDGHFREDSTGTAYGPVSFVEGDLPRIPPSGLEARTVELFVKASRGDIDQLPDSAIDDISARAYFRPSYLQSPES